MNRRDKKRIAVLVERLSRRRQQLVGDTQQPDGPSEIRALNSEIAEIEGELRRLREPEAARD